MDTYVQKHFDVSLQITESPLSYLNII
jgi:hypothetical protein